MPSIVPGVRPATGSPFATSVELAGHEADTTAVHGIINTAALATKSAATVVVLGDSLASLNVDPATLGTSPDVGYRGARGFFDWANAFLGERLRVLDIDGHSGETVTQIKGYAAAAVALNPGWLVINAGANSVTSGHTSATITTDLAEILTTAIDAGVRPVLMTIPPSTSYDTTAEHTALTEANDWIRAAPAAYPGTVVVDAWSVLVDPSDGQPGTAMSIDAVHYSMAGAARVGRLFADVVGPLIPPSRPNIVTFTHPDNACGNPHMADGTGWTTIATDGVTYTWPVSTGDDLGSESLWTCSGVVSTGEFGVSYEESTSGGRWVPGDTVQASAEVQWDVSTRVAGDNYFRPYMSIAPRLSDNSFPTVGAKAFHLPGAEATVSADLVPSTGSVVLLTNRFVVPADTNRLYYQLRVRGLATGTIKWRKFSAWKV